MAKYVIATNTVIYNLHEAIENLDLNEGEDKEAMARGLIEDWINEDFGGVPGSLKIVETDELPAEFVTE